MTHLTDGSSVKGRLIQPKIMYQLPLTYIKGWWIRRFQKIKVAAPWNSRSSLYHFWSHVSRFGIREFINLNNNNNGTPESNLYKLVVQHSMSHMFLVFICNLISCSAAVLLSLSIYMLLFSRKFLTREDSTGEDVAEWMKGIWPSHHDPTHKKIQGKNYWITMHAHDGQEEGGQEDDFHYSKERQEKHVCVVIVGQSMTSPSVVICT